MTDNKNAIEAWHRRREKRLAERTRMDFEVGDYGPDEAGDKGTSHGNTRLPYGLCKSAGIDTTGMSPSEAWEALEGKTGVSAKEAYKDIKKYGTAKAVDIPKKSENGNLPGTEELSNRGPIPEPFEKGKPEKSKAVQDALKRIGSVKSVKTEEQIQEQLDKLKSEYGEKGVVGFVTAGGREHHFDLSHPMIASNIAYFKKDGPLFMFAGKDESDAKSEVKQIVDGWKKSGDIDNILRAYDYDLVELRKQKGRGDITVEEYESLSGEKKKERSKRVLKSLPTYDDCKTTRQVAARMDAQGNFKAAAYFSSNAAVENAREAAVSAEKMFNIFPTMKGRVESINASVPKSKSYAWVENKTDSGIYLSKTYMADRKKLEELYDTDVKYGFHPPGTDSKAIVYHEFTHVIDLNLSSYANKHGGIPGHPGAKVSTAIARDMALARGITLTELKKRVSKYALKKYKETGNNELEFLAECMAEYLGSPHPREIAVDCANRLFKYMRQFWGDKAVNESAI